MLRYLTEKFKTQKSKIEDWFSMYEEKAKGDPVYSSVDLRNAGYKIAPVDTNIFPAGFNNLCPSYRKEAGKLFRNYMQKYHPNAKRTQYKNTFETAEKNIITIWKARSERMKVGKGSRKVTEVIIQEGIPTMDRFKGLVAEPVIYLVIGYSNEYKQDYDLESLAMMYKNIARIASLAAGCEIKMSNAYTLHH